MEKIMMRRNGCVCPTFTSFWSDIEVVEFTDYERHWKKGDNKIPCNRPLNLIKRFDLGGRNVLHYCYGLVEDPMSLQVWIIQMTGYEDYFIIERKDDVMEDYNYKTEGARARCRKIMRYVVDDVEYINKYEALMHFNFAECLKILCEKRFYPIANFNNIMKDNGVTHFGLANIMQNNYTDETCFFYDGEAVVFYHEDDAILRVFDENFANLSVLDDYTNKVFE